MAHEDPQAISPLHEQLGQMGADEAGRAGDQNETRLGGSGV